MRHKGDTLAERCYTDRALLDVRRWLDRLPPLALRAAGSTGPLTRVLTREAGESWEELRTDETKGVAAITGSNDANSLRDAGEQHLALVGERGLEPPTRSTQSYAPTEANDPDGNDLGNRGANASQVLPTESPETRRPCPPVGDLLDALKGLGPEALRRLADALERKAPGGPLAELVEKRLEGRERQA